MGKKIITLSSDFEKQSQGIGCMEGAIFKINPEAKVIHLMHGLPAFDIVSATRAMETVKYIPAGIHVCVVDPGVGTERKGIIVKAKRGDCFVGPDNGCLMAAPRILGGIEKIVALENEKYMLTPVSPIFHGRDVFSPAAAYLSKGIPIEDFGRELTVEECVQASYKEAMVEGNKINATIIHINHFGSPTLNIMAEEWDKLGIKIGEVVEAEVSSRKLELPFKKTFGEVEEGKPLMMKDDYGRIEIAVNLGSFKEKYSAKVGDKITLRKKGD